MCSVRSMEYKEYRTNEDSSRTNGATHTDYVGDTIEDSNDIGVSKQGNTNVGNSTSNMSGRITHASNSSGGNNNRRSSTDRLAYTCHTVQQVYDI